GFRLLAGLALGRFARLGITPGGLLRLALLAFCALDCEARLVLGAALRVQLFLLLPRLLLEHVPLDIGALAAHLDVDRARPALAARELQLALGFALQCDAPRRRGRILPAVRASQVRQQLE